MTGGIGMGLALACAGESQDGFLQAPLAEAPEVAADENVSETVPGETVGVDEISKRREVDISKDAHAAADRGSGLKLADEGPTFGEWTTDERPYLEYHGMMDGAPILALCVPGDHTSSVDYLGVSRTGTAVEIYCPGNRETFVTQGGFGLSLDLAPIQGAFLESEPRVFEFRIVQPGRNKAAFGSSDNRVAVEVTGSYDPETGRLSGSLQGEWGPATHEYHLEGVLYGSFSVVVPEVENP